MDSSNVPGAVTVSCSPTLTDGISGCRKIVSDSSTAVAYADGLSDEPGSEEDIDGRGVSNGFGAKDRVGDGPLDEEKRGGGWRECMASEEDVLGGGDR